MATRRELIEAVAARYRAAGRQEKKEILDEFVKVTGFHRKHAIRALKKSLKQETREPRQRSRIYDEAVREALTIIREAAESNLRQAPPPSDRGADRCDGAPWAFETRFRRAGKFAVHERRHRGPAAENGPGHREAGPSQIGDQHAIAEEYRRADVWRLDQKCLCASSTKSKTTWRTP